MKKELADLKERLQRISQKSSTKTEQPKPVEPAKKVEPEPETDVPDELRREIEQQEQTAPEEREVDELYPTETKTQPQPVTPAPTPIPTPVPVEQPKPQEQYVDLSKMQHKEPEVEPPQSRVLTDEELERLRQLENEKERLQNNGAFRLEQIFQLNRLNENIEALIYLLQGGEK